MIVRLRTYDLLISQNSFQNDEYISEEKAYPTDKVYLKAGKLYRIKITKILNQVESTTNDNV